MTPPGGVVVDNLLYQDANGNWKDTGPVQMPAGWLIGYDGELLSEDDQ